jgi:hypothetical protein
LQQGDQKRRRGVSISTSAARVEANMTTYRLVSQPDGIWLESFNDDEDAWEIIDGPFDTRHEGASALRRCRDRQERRDMHAA